MVKVYDELKEKFKKLIFREKKLSKEDLINWCKNNSIGILTICSIIEDLEKEKLIKATYNTETLLIDLPEKVEVIVEEEKNSEKEKQAAIPTITKTNIIVKKNQRQKLKRKSKGRVKSRKTSSIINFLCEETREPTKKPVENLTYESPSSENLEYEDHVDFFSKIENTEYRKALIYLARYRSVGEIRFALDLKKEGIDDALRIIRKIIEDGYATRSSLGVINATKKLPKVKTMFSLADLLN